MMAMGHIELKEKDTNMNNGSMTLHKNGKYHPKTVWLSLGDIFDRLPAQLSHNILEGTYPIYGRVITKVLRVSDHKLEIVLGDNLEGIVKHNTITSDETLIGVYGELELYIDNIKEIECQKK